MSRNDFLNKFKNNVFSYTFYLWFVLYSSMFLNRIWLDNFQKLKKCLSLKMKLFTSLFLGLFMSFWSISQKTLGKLLPVYYFSSKILFSIWSSSRFFDKKRIEKICCTAIDVSPNFDVQRIKLLKSGLESLHYVNFCAWEYNVKSFNII